MAIHTLFKVFLLSLLTLALVFIHLLRMSCILELILRYSSRVSSFFRSWMMDEEKSFNDFLVVWLSLVLTGLILIWLGLEGKRLLGWSER